MDIDKLFKDLTGRHEVLSKREAELRNKITEIKRVRELISQKEANVSKLETELAALLGEPS